MIPAGAVQIGLERIREGASRCDRALLDGRTVSRETMGSTVEDRAGDLHAVVPRCLFLQDPMPMHCGTFFGTGDLVVDGDHERVSPIGLEGGRRELPIDQEDARVHSVGCNEPPRDGEVVPSNDACVRRIGVGIGIAGCCGAPRIPIGEGLIQRSVDVSRDRIGAVDKEAGCG